MTPPHGRSCQAEKRGVPAFGVSSRIQCAQPKELEEQAMINGAGRWHAMTGMIRSPLPAGRPVRRHVLLHTGAERFPLRPPLPQQIEPAHRADQRRGRAGPWGRSSLGQLMAGTLLGFIPVAMTYSSFVKYYVADLTAGTVEG